ncbi:hypothetical protein BVRB_2g025090 [Beta vulgaris subsp. vulgaris]|nr:hypothetical protein BVRB_2g025090 [Beta vulgaris subsp. vulgaris]
MLSITAPRRRSPTMMIFLAETLALKTALTNSFSLLFFVGYCNVG